MIVGMYPRLLLLFPFFANTAAFLKTVLILKYSFVYI